MEFWHKTQVGDFCKGSHRLFFNSNSWVLKSPLVFGGESGTIIDAANEEEAQQKALERLQFEAIKQAQEVGVEI